MAKQQAVAQVNLDVASLMTLKMPTQWTDGEGRCSAVRITEAAAEIFRGSRDGMLWKMDSAVLETHPGDARGASTAAYKGDRSRGGLWWESEGSILYRLRVWDSITRPEGRDPALFAQLKSGG